MTPGCGAVLRKLRRQVRTPAGSAPPFSQGGSIQVEPRLHAFPRPEGDVRLSRDDHGLASSTVSPIPGLTGADGERAEVTQFHPTAIC